MSTRRLGRALAGACAAALACAVLMGPASRPATAAEYGMSDGRAELFDAPLLHELDLTRVRLVLPWDAALRPGTWNTWLDRAQRQGFPILAAPTIDKPNNCETGSCSPPTPAQYGAALRALLARYPGIEAVEAWNEPNHSTQPTAGNPRLAAAYFDAAFASCVGRCTAVAGNLLDAESMASYLAAYRGALTTKPAVWGIHDYYDATYFARSGLDQMLALTDGPVWITEIGGLVSFRPPGSSGLTHDERRAADSLRWMFTLAGRTPRLERMYLYGMWQEPLNPFDSALLRTDNTERESAAVARAYIGSRRARLTGPEAPELFAPGTPGSVAPADEATPALAVRPPAAVAKLTGRLRIDGKRAAVRGEGRRLTLGLRCIGTTTCRGRLEIRAPGWTTSKTLTLRAGAARAIRLKAPAKAARTLGRKTSRRAWARVCDAGRCTGAARVGLVRR